MKYLKSLTVLINKVQSCIKIKTHFTWFHVFYLWVLWFSWTTLTRIFRSFVFYFFVLFLCLLAGQWLGWQVIYNMILIKINGLLVNENLQPSLVLFMNILLHKYKQHSLSVWWSLLFGKSRYIHKIIEAKGTFLLICMLATPHRL